MFANDKSIDNLTELFKEVKKYLKLQGEYVKLDLVEKLTILLSTLTLIFVLIILGTMAAFLPFFYAGICISIGYRQFSCRICYYRRNTHITCVYNLQIAPKINISANG